MPELLPHPFTEHLKEMRYDTVCPRLAEVKFTPDHLWRRIGKSPARLSKRHMRVPGIGWLTWRFD